MAGADRARNRILRGIAVAAMATGLILSSVAASGVAASVQIGPTSTASTTSTSTAMSTTNPSVFGGSGWWGREPTLSAAAAAEARLAAEAAPTPASTPQPAPVSTPPTTSSKTSTAAGPLVLKANQFAFPAISISTKAVRWWDCYRDDAMPNYVYRWGCAGSNNVFLLGHSYGMFKPLWSAYHSGALKLGLVAYYAGSDGKMHAYRVTTIRHEEIAHEWDWRPWAQASQPVPSMTLITCDGAGDRYRIIVRLVAIS